MHRSELFSALAVLVCVPLAGSAQPWLTHENGLWVRTFTGSAAATPRLRINAHGPVTLDAGNAGARQYSYTVKVSVRARTPEQARRILQQYSVKIQPQGEWLVMTTPGGPVTSFASVTAPSLKAVEISTSDGAVEATGIDGTLDVDSQADQLKADRIHGDCKLITGGGDIQVGTVDGALHCATGAGHISVGTVRGIAVLQTNGGNITADQIGGAATVETAGGEVRIKSAGGAVTAVNGGGPIVIGKADGVVTTRDMAGPVQVNAAAGVRCESGNGGIQLSNITGPMRVSTAWGSILASLLGSRLADSTLATANGDITVVIPSNVGVTIKAENGMADTLRRIVSDFREIQPKRRPTGAVFAEGPLNGGGPLLQITATAGTIYLRRQR
jgi:DUF4097 and DUF4098 domain-containing protein YvlB